MSAGNGSSGTGGISFMGALALIFITLKLTGTIDWSWWLVLAPLWVGFGLVLVLFAIPLLLAVIVALIVGVVALVGGLAGAIRKAWR